MTKQPLTVQIAKWSANHPWFAIIGWILFVTLCVSIGNITGTHKTEPKDFWVGEAGRAEAIAATGNLQQTYIEKIMITSPQGVLNNVTASKALRNSPVGCGVWIRWRKWMSPSNPQMVPHS